MKQLTAKLVFNNKKQVVNLIKKKGKLNEKSTDKQREKI